MEEKKQTLAETFSKWRDAVVAYTGGSYAAAIDVYMQIENLSARILYNMACAHIKLHQHAPAIQCLSTAVQKDEHLAIAFFQRGVLHMNSKNTEAALKDLETTRTLLRGNIYIDYKPLGMLCKLYLCEVLLNMALVRIHDNQVTEAVRLLTEALHDADDRQRKVLMRALESIQDQRTDFIAPTYISIDNIFTPPKIITSNLEKKDVMGKAKVVSSLDINDTDASFNGMKRVQELQCSPLYLPKLTPPKSPLGRVKHFFEKRQFRSNSLDETSSDIAIRGSKSTGDLQRLANSRGNTVGHLLHSTSFDATKSSASNEEIQTTTAVGSKKRMSLGSVFGNTLTVVSHALSTSCDVLTALAAPPSDEYGNRGYYPIKLEQESGDSVDTDWDIAMSVEKVAVTVHTQNKFGVINNQSNKETVVTDMVDSRANTNSTVCERENICQRENENKYYNITPSKGTELKKSRPPPPSYPPPPLPPKIVITL